MILSKSQQDKIVAAVKNKITFTSCLACKSEAGFEAGDILELRQYNEGLRLDGALIIPVISCMCKHCGHTQLFSAIRLGVVHPNGKLAV